MTTPPLLAVEFEAYSTAHLVVLAIGAALVLPTVLLGRRVVGTGSERAVRRAFAVALAAATLPLQVVDFLPGNYGLHSTLPLHLCDLAWVTAAYAAWTRRPAAAAIAYYWGLLLTPQGIVTPTLDQGFPSPEFVAYWGMHLLIVLAAVFLVWGLGLRPTWRGYRLALVATATWAALVFSFNALVGTNYGYLNHKPGSATLLDLLGPWPVYVVVEVALVAGAWALMTLPWTRNRVPAPD